MKRNKRKEKKQGKKKIDLFNKLSQVDKTTIICVLVSAIASIIITYPFRPKDISEAYLEKKIEKLEMAKDSLQNIWTGLSDRNYIHAKLSLSQMGDQNAVEELNDILRCWIRTEAIYKNTMDYISPNRYKALGKDVLVFQLRLVTVQNNIKKYPNFKVDPADLKNDESFQKLLDAGRVMHNRFKSVILEEIADTIETYS